ncbi:MAG: hypothetical protein ACLPVF_13865 [Acidimicrobiales bacterium]
MDRYDTPDVFNQTPPLEGHDVFAVDRALGEAADREGATWAPFCASRLASGAGVFGTLPGGTDAGAILARHAPV